MVNFESNMPLVTEIYKKYFSNMTWLKEDIMQSGYIGLLKACNKYKAENGYKFSTFAMKCIKNEILMYLRKENKHIKNDTNFIIRLKDDEEVEIIDELGFNDIDEFSYTRKFIENCEHKNIIKLWLQGYTQAEISRELNINYKLIGQIIKKEVLNFKKLEGLCKH